MALTKTYPKLGTTCKVKFELSADRAKGATTARVLGDFNNWNTRSKGSKMKKNDDGSFTKVIALKQGKEFQFRYLIDGKRWENDESADKYVPAPNSPDDNSVVIVGFAH
ncbi:MAG: isoamylase early set domain-containing protein [Treponema sp.]|jgi:1,4-alpha-glucan branching enzyme|nr:isoamylase early set domain-containing protein [Treponema sp.]